jgi:hypothetical protein
VVSGGQRVDQAMLAGLRATLDDEVGRVVSAARPTRIGTADEADVAGVAAAPDALDELIDAFGREEAGR